MSNRKDHKKHGAKQNCPKRRKERKKRINSTRVSQVCMSPNQIYNTKVRYTMPDSQIDNMRVQNGEEKQTRKRLKIHVKSSELVEGKVDKARTTVFYKE